MKKNYKLITMIGLAGALFSVNALADDATDIEALPTGTTGVVYDNYSGAYPVVNAILSAPGTVGGHAYTGWSFLAQDSTGSLDIFAASSITTGFGFTPHLGDAITVTGKYSPFDQIPEMATPYTAMSAISSGNPVPGPLTTTIATINVGTLPFTVAGYLLELDNVTIGGSGGVSGLFPTYAQANLTTETFTVSDGANTMTLFDWVTSYSVDGAMGGNAVPTGPVNMTGFVDVFGTGTAATAEFVPMSITAAVPEPSVMNLCGAGSVLAYVVSRLRKKA